MKKIIEYFALMLSLLVIVSCASIDKHAGTLSEIDYEEITAEKYFNLNEAALYPLFGSKGYKITDAYIQHVQLNYDYNIGKRILEIKLSSSSDVFGNDIWVYAESLINNDSMLERIEYAMQESKYNGHFTVYLYKKDTLLGSSRIILSNIEGVPSEEQIEADKAVAEAERKAQEEAEKEARAKKEAELNAKGKALANGYKYHGIEELEKNRELFLNGALESGHAYYISGFVVKNSGSMAQIEYGDIFFLSSQSNPVYIDYINQKVKAEVIDAGIVTFMGQTAETPLTVVVAGGKGFSNTPVVLGIVESSVNDRLNEAIEEINSNL